MKKININWIMFSSLIVIIILMELIGKYCTGN